MLAGKVSLSFSFSTCCTFACDWGKQRHWSDGPCLLLPWFEKTTERIHLKGLLFLLTPFFHWSSPLLISSSTVEFLLVYWSQIPSAFEPQKEENGKKRPKPTSPQSLYKHNCAVFHQVSWLATRPRISIVIWIDSELLPALPTRRQNLHKLQWGQKDPHSQNDHKTTAVSDSTRNQSTQDLSLIPGWQQVLEKCQMRAETDPPHGTALTGYHEQSFRDFQMDYKWADTCSVQLVHLP